jgi:hypothetical protein
VTAFRRQAESCVQQGSPLYAELLGRLADDIEAGGPTAEILRGHEDDPEESALSLRLLGSVHRLVLERRAGALGAYYPSVGGTWEPDGGTAAFLALLEREPDVVREWLDQAPQTNEVGRASALVGGLLHLRVEHRAPVRLFEIGSSGGLNLLADRFEYVDDDGQRFGQDGSPVRLEPVWSAEPTLSPWPELRFEESAGCDINPIDVTTTAGRLALTAYVWPDQAHRLERLRGALALAQDHPPAVRRLGAADFVDQISLENETATVLWHSVMWQYLPAVERDRITQRIQRLGDQADEDGSTFVHLFLEPTRRTPESEREFLVVLTAWPGGERRVLGRAAPHGLPVTWDRGDT